MSHFLSKWPVYCSGTCWVNRVSNGKTKQQRVCEATAKKMKRKAATTAEQCTAAHALLEATGKEKKKTKKGRHMTAFLSVFWKCVETSSCTWNNEGQVKNIKETAAVLGKIKVPALSLQHTQIISHYEIRRK